MYEQLKNRVQRVGKELELEIIGISCLTNYGSGLIDKPLLTHADVLKVSCMVQEKLSNLMQNII